jgi:homoserine dehydrogenase
MGVPCLLNEVTCEGISAITAGDIQNARENNSRWKLIGNVEYIDGNLTASVKPEMIALTHPLAGIMGPTNAATFSTDLLGDITIVGAGAGKIETGFSILSDLLEIHRLS